MKKKETLITVLDIGASKVCCLISNPQKENAIDVLGYGICHHDCLKYGMVVDINGLSDAISKAVYMAEEVSGKKVQSAFFNISGHHIKGIASKGEVVISDKDNEITKHDVDRVMANAKAIHMPYERDIIYSVRKGYTVDGEKGIVNPTGMFGIKLETELYLVSAKISIIDNLKKSVRQSGIGIENYCISGIGTSHAVLSQNEKELGVILIDIGADLTEVLIFLEGKLNFISILNIGGDSITKAISEKLRIPEGIAERLKIENSKLESKNSEEKISVGIGSRKRTIPFSELNKITLSEYRNIFNVIKEELVKSGCAEDASSGIVICGEPAIKEGCLELAEPILNLPVRKGHIMGLGSSPKPLPSHIYATAIGLLKMGSEHKRSKRSILTMGPKNMAMSVVENVRRLYNDYF